MIIINGNVLGQVTVNGKVISNTTTNTKKVDIFKKESANNISHINIHSNMANVELSTSIGNEISAHLVGSIAEEQDINLQITKTSNKITISVSVSTNGACLPFISSDLKLKIHIPTKVFEQIFVENINGNITMYSANASDIETHCDNGNIIIDVLPKSLQAYSKNGNIKINAIAKCDSWLNISTKNGNIDVRLTNISISRIDTCTKNGCNTHKPDMFKDPGEHSISGNISSKNGNISLKY